MDSGNPILADNGDHPRGGDIASSGGPDVESRRLEADIAARTRELDIRQQEANLKSGEFAHIVAESNRARWSNPLLLAIFAATIAAVGGVAVSWLNGQASQQAEIFKAESARILEAIKANNPDKAKENLDFLIQAGLVSGDTAQKVRIYLTRSPPGRGPSLPGSDTFTRSLFRQMPMELHGFTIRTADAGKSEGQLFIDIVEVVPTCTPWGVSGHERTRLYADVDFADGTHDTFMLRDFRRNPVNYHSRDYPGPKIGNRIPVHITPSLEGTCGPTMREDLYTGETPT